MCHYFVGDHSRTRLVDVRRSYWSRLTVSGSDSMPAETASYAISWTDDGDPEAPRKLATCCAKFVAISYGAFILKSSGIQEYPIQLFSRPHLASCQAWCRHVELRRWTWSVRLTGRGASILLQKRRKWDESLGRLESGHTNSILCIRIHEQSTNENLFIREERGG